jgi:hypothetical protein
MQVSVVSYLGVDGLLGAAAVVALLEQRQRQLDEEVVAEVVGSEGALDGDVSGLGSGPGLGEHAEAGGDHARVAHQHVQGQALGGVGSHVCADGLEGGEVERGGEETHVAGGLGEDGGVVLDVGVVHVGHCGLVGLEGALEVSIRLLGAARRTAAKHDSSTHEHELTRCL